MGQTETRVGGKPSIFKDLVRIGKPQALDIIPLFSDSVQLASSRTREYLLFQDPENKFFPSTGTLNEIFLMTYITRSVQLQMTNAFNCTAMTKEQKILLGADWVWAVIEAPSKNPKIQVAVQVLHPSDGEDKGADDFPMEVYTEAMEMARMESANRTKAERMIEFCSSIGQDCHALFLFFGRKNDPSNIYGVLSNNFHAAIGRCARIDQTFIENFFKGSKSFVTPARMLQAIIRRKQDEPLTMVIKFT
ncbi:rab15 effector protein [Megalops cyprinoides]|uniref:rab15 effector protein n=1 Tax=Megalops cyprinoides TaxID=118141 RepID=UPI001864CA33|nr:rab15 effector protein [Megalops cyprinoides]XP_036390472.1 rab15 effector protein [Megalops cyprinoides]XP_036390473.1 rab15 effector protein [Megalops cyprinoides]